MRGADEFLLDPDVAYLNHGSFGALPRVVVEAHEALRRTMEANPHRFLRVEYPALVRESRAALGAWIGRAPDEIVLVRGVTEGIQAVADAVPLDAGTRVVTTAHDYSSVLRILGRRCAASGARLDVVDLSATEGHRTGERVVERLGPDVAAVVLSHITSPTALCIDLAGPLAAARRHGAVSVVDGAHGPGHVDLDLAALGADYYVGALHKWASCPRGAGFVAAARPMLDRLRPVLISLNDECADVVDRFAWPGTFDPTPWLTIATARAFHDGMRARGRPQRSAELCAHAEERLVELDGVEPVAVPANRAPFMRTVRVPVDEPVLKHALRSSGVWAWTGRLGGETLLRVSVGPYTGEDDLDRLRRALAAVLGADP